MEKQCCAKRLDRNESKTLSLSHTVSMSNAHKQHAGWSDHSECSTRISSKQFVFLTDCVYICNLCVLLAVAVV